MNLTIADSTLRELIETNNKRKAFESSGDTVNNWDYEVACVILTGIASAIAYMAELEFKYQPEVAA